ncbi:MAG: DUF433 domain-containing protein [Bdellovibrionales bacterium]|nr:DUF433 domain-containing protein [Bdellovibrionales bacterium]
MEHDRQYVEQCNGGFYVAGTRVSLDSIIYSFQAGDSPETIRQNFSSLALEQVYDAIAFYLAHEHEVDANILEGEAEREIPSLAQATRTLTLIWTVFGMKWRRTLRAFVLIRRKVM